MTVSPCRANLFLDQKELYQFLSACQQDCSCNQTRFVSISTEIESVDPLVALEEIAQPNQLNFYFENKSKKQAIAAIDSVAKLHLEGKQRFENAQKFIKSHLANIITIGNLNNSFTGPCFCCSFGFFDSNTQANSPFPPATVFLPRWQIIRDSDRCILVANLLINAEGNLELLIQQFYQTIKKISEIKNINRDDINQNLINKNIKGSDNFKETIISVLKSIRSNNLEKLVIAHTQDIISPSSFKLFKSLNNLRRLYPNCYIFSISNGKGQNFIGASPERLISIHNQELITDALAGSAPRGKTPSEDTDLAKRLLSSDKENHEHQVVIDFITQRLYHLGIVPQLLPPQLRQLSNIQHLWTPISAKVPAKVTPLEIVAELHPTPAVAGVPRDVACEAITRYENFERGLYAAPLGWVDYQGNSEFIVGIRSALIDSDRARLYAGAGIVAGSHPDKELAEIQLKLQALLKALV